MTRRRRQTKTPTPQSFAPLSRVSFPGGRGGSALGGSAIREVPERVHGSARKGGGRSVRRDRRGAAADDCEGNHRVAGRRELSDRVRDGTIARPVLFADLGGYTSIVQVRRDIPLSIDQALDVAAGEGYPGRHVYHVLLEQNLFRDRGWVEFSIDTRPSPRSLIEDGTSRCAIELAFPGGQRTAFERDVLYPLAGLDGSRAAEYAKVRDVAERLADTARPPAEGEFARDLIRRYLQSRGKSMGERWRAFGWLLSSPWTPSDLARASEPNMVPNSSDLTPR